MTVYASSVCRTFLSCGNYLLLWSFVGIITVGVLVLLDNLNILLLCIGWRHLLCFGDLLPCIIFGFALDKHKKCEEVSCIARLASNVEWRLRRVGRRGDPKVDNRGPEIRSYDGNTDLEVKHAGLRGLGEVFAGAGLEEGVQLVCKESTISHLFAI